MSNYSFCDDSISDLHKDAYGFRPSQGFWEFWSTASDVEKQKEWDSLCDALRRREAENQELEQAAVVDFENRIASLMEHGARNRKMAVRWLAEAFETNGDVSYLEWNLGIPYGYLTKEFGSYFTKEAA